MMKSMTGYGRYEGVSERVTCEVEIRAVNHRFCEISFRSPRSTMPFEEVLKKVIQEHVSRGRIDVHIQIRSGQGLHKKLHIDWDLLDTYVATSEQLKRKYELDDKIRLTDLLSMPNALEIEEQSHLEVLKEPLVQAVHYAVLDLVEMRSREGKSLQQHMLRSIALFKQVLERIEQAVPEAVEAYRLKVEERIHEFLDQRVEMDEQRLLNEIAFFAERSAIDEELTRLNSHVQQFESLLRADGAVGRKLDFIIQEMNREVNTIGSKSQSVHISQDVIELKSQLEKLREQVQNIE